MQQAVCAIIALRVYNHPKPNAVGEADLRELGVKLAAINKYQNMLAASLLGASVLDSQSL